MEVKNLTTNQLNQNGYSNNLLTKDKVGALFTFPINHTPEDCLSCDGYSLQISDYKELHKIIGTKFNKSGDVAGTFRVPDYNITKRFLQPGSNVGSLIEAGLPTHTHVITMKRCKKSGDDTSTVWSYSQNTVGNGTVTSEAPSNAIYGKSTTVQPPSQIVHICIKYK